MMVPLVIAQLRRARWALVTVLIAALGGAVATGFGARMNGAMVGMFCHNALSAIGFFWSREMRVLPIPPRMARRAAWYAAVSLPLIAFVMRVSIWTTLRVVSGQHDLPVSLEQIGLMSLFDVLFVSAGFTILDRDKDPVPSANPATKFILKMVLFLPWFFLPFVAPEIIPRNLAAWQWYNWLALAVLLSLAARPLFTDLDEWPCLGVLHDAGRFNAKAPGPQPEAGTATDLRRGLNRLTGFRRLLPASVTGAFVTAVLAFCAFPVISLFTGVSAPAPMSAALSDLMFLVVSGTWVLAMVPPGFSSGLQPWLRQLKVLPVPTLTLVTINTLSPWRGIVLLWAFACLSHMVQTGAAPETLRLGALLGVGGLASLVAALMTRFNSIAGLMIGMMLPLLLGMTGFMLFDFGFVILRPEHLPLAGGLALVSAIVLNYRTIGLASSTAPAYRQTFAGTGASR